MISIIELEDYMNAVLVNAGARPAALFEYSDYVEDNVEGRIQYISEKFPDLYFLLLHNGSSFLISKHPYTKEDIYTHGKLDHRKLGHVLGLPCADEFEFIKNDKDSWGIEIEAYLNPRFYHPDIQLIANVCLTDETFETMNTMAAQFHRIFQADPLLKHVVQDVRAVATRHSQTSMAKGGQRKLRQTKKTRKTRRKTRKRN
jgi:hypothetical protein